MGPLFTTSDMAEVFADTPNLSPSAAHLLGTQSEGRDILALLMIGAPSTLLIGLIGGGAAVLLGGTLGFFSGYYGGVADLCIRTVVDAALTIPPLAVLILISASFPAMSIATMGLVVAATAWMSTTRTVRAQLLSLRERDYVRMAKLSGLSDIRIMALELAPNLIPFLAASTVNAITTAILASVGLEVLGLGPRDTTTLGQVMYEAIYYTAMWRGMWWWWLPPLVMLVLIFQGLFFMSSGLDRLANPRLEATA